MKLRHFLYCASIVFTTACFTTAANSSTVILDFDPNFACGASKCTYYSSIAANYGSTSELTVDFQLSDYNSPVFWYGGFGNLDHAIFQNSAGHSNDPLLIKFSATPGFAISGIEFNYATYRLNYPTTGYTYTTNNPNNPSPGFVQLPYTAIASNVRFNFLPSTEVAFAFGQDAYYNGIGGIAIHLVSVVPEISELSMLASGIFVLGWFVRRREIGLIGNH
jgi:hypothetical protein